jgi:Mitochondrial 39-S ribosomal protein L47 (MRP-L47)
MLLTEQQLSRRRGIPLPQPERIKKVRKSMGAIKQVLGERKRDHLGKLSLRREEESGKIDNNEKIDDPVVVPSIQKD